MKNNHPAATKVIDRKTIYITKNKKILPFLKKLLVPLMLLTMACLLLFSSLSESAVYDEKTLISAGNEFLVHHDFRADPFNPPFARELLAIPLIINQHISVSEKIFWARMIAIFFTLLLGIVVYLFSRKLYGESAGLLALFLFILEPNMLANGHYAQSDIIFTFFYLMAFFLYMIWEKKISLLKLIIFGGIIGLLLSTKTTALPFFFLPFLVLLIIKTKIRNILTLHIKKNNYKKIFVFAVSAVFFLWATYFFTFEPLLGYRYDPQRPAIKLAKTNSLIHFALYEPLPLGSYLSTLKEQVMFNYSGLYRRDSMLFGNISHTGQFGLYLFPLILIKVPIELFLLFFITLFIYRKRIANDRILIIPLLCILFFVCFSKTIVVLRYILPIIPLVIIYTSQIIKKINKSNYIVFILLLLLIICENFSAFPYYISYVNGFLGKTGYKYVFDANYDWGQGLIALKKFQDINHIENLNIAYFGQDNPAHYGIRYHHIYDNILYYNSYDFSKLNIKKNTTFAISTTCWYLCGYYKQPEFSDKNISAVVGGSILIFKF